MRWKVTTLRREIPNECVTRSGEAPSSSQEVLPASIVNHIPQAEIDLDQDRFLANLRSARRGAAGGPIRNDSGAHQGGVGVRVRLHIIVAHMSRICKGSLAGRDSPGLEDWPDNGVAEASGRHPWHCGWRFHPSSGCAHPREAAGTRSRAAHVTFPVCTVPDLNASVSPTSLMRRQISTSPPPCCRWTESERSTSSRGKLCYRDSWRWMGETLPPFRATILRFTVNALVDQQHGRHARDTARRGCETGRSAHARFVRLRPTSRLRAREVRICFFHAASGYALPSTARTCRCGPPPCSVLCGRGSGTQGFRSGKVRPHWCGTWI